MNRYFYLARNFFVAASFLVLLSLPAIAQSNPSKGVKELDSAIKAGLNAIETKKWDTAEREFAKAKILLANEKLSPFLFENLILPDEDRSKKIVDKTEQQITAWRHATGEGQAIRLFQMYTAALAGKRAEADKFSEDVYDLQNPLWGLSWRVFNSAVYDFFDKRITPEKSESYGLYLYYAGELLSGSGDERGTELIERSQAFLPDDAGVAATLAGIYIMSGKTEEAKKQANISLKIKPDQARVLIDLANAEWILGDNGSAKLHAAEANKLRPDLPGPNATLAFIALDENDLRAAKAYAEKGSELSKKHAFYQTVLAAYESAAGHDAQALSIMNEAWGDEFPSKEMLMQWFFRRKPLDLILGLK